MSDDAKNLLSWFGKRKESVVQEGIRGHALAVLDCVMELRMALRAMESSDPQEAGRCIERLFVNEREADSLEDELCAQLSIGELGPQEREDLLHFVRKTDKIANWSKEAALHLQLIISIGAQVPQSVWEQLAQITTILETEVNYLMNAIKKLGTDDRDEIQNCIQGVRGEEYRIDRATFDVTRDVYLSDMDHKAIMLTTKLIESLEMAADTCKGCSDTISILVVARGM